MFLIHLLHAETHLRTISKRKYCVFLHIHHTGILVYDCDIMYFILIIIMFGSMYPHSAHIGITAAAAAQASETKVLRCSVATN